MSESDLSGHLDEVARSTDRLLESVDRLTEADVRGPSLLPGWTRAHVLTHLARNADGLAELAAAARAGAAGEMYPGGAAARAAAIEAGAERGLGDLRLDLGESAERLLGAFVPDFPAAARESQQALLSGTPLRGWEIPLIRLQEVEIHHVDLDAGYTTLDWPEAFVTRTLDRCSAQVRPRGDVPVAHLSRTDGTGSWQVGPGDTTLSGPASELLAWLTGRSTGAGLSLDSGQDVPPAPRWS
ncbi:MAG: maleylpyruvate isomerase [Actinomycetota bacterium]|nr:maleylpyruvate isomerase [Actinomycetota bacterium]